MRASALLRVASVVVILLLARVAGADDHDAGPTTALPPPITAELRDLPLVGDKDGILYVRDAHDLVRLYPEGHLDLDAHGFLGPGASDVAAEVAGVDLGPRFFVRRARLGLGAELFERVHAHGGIDLTNHPSIDSALADGRKTRVALDDAWSEVSGGRGLRLRMGLFASPLSIENRTAVRNLPLMERNIAVRGFIAPGAQVLAVMLGGAMRHGLLRWDVGASAAERTGPDDFARGFDGIGRLTVTRIPPSGPHGWLRQLDVGVSSRVGARNPRDGQTTVPALTSAQGFALWNPTRIDEAGRATTLISSGASWAVGLESHARLAGALDVRSEAFVVSRGTEEAGRPGSPRGRIDAFAAYAQVSWWPLQAFAPLSGEPPETGNDPQPTHLELARVVEPNERHGVEVALLGARTSARLVSFAEPAATQGTIGVYQAGVAVSYWHNRRFRITLNPNLYVEDADPMNRARVPGDLAGRADANCLWEIAARTTVAF